MMKKVLYTCLIIFSVLLMLVVDAFAHPHILNVEYDQCSQEENIAGEDELWYKIDETFFNRPNYAYHLSDDTLEVRYYFSPNEKYDTTKTWADHVKSIWEEKGVSLTNAQADNIVNQIQSIFVSSMKKWNDVYYYYYNSYGVMESKKIITVTQGTSENHNLVIYPEDAGSIAWTMDCSVLDQDWIESGHFHCPLYYMFISIEQCFDLISNSDTINSAKSVVYRSNSGAHELGHILGLTDLDAWDCQCSCELCNDSDSSTNCSYLGHHEEALMGYGEHSSRVMYITYRDIAGVSITRGFHTDDDHRWMIRTRDDGSQYLICSLCNGIRTEYELDEDGTYEGQTPVVYGSCNDDHSLTGGNMLLVATDCVRDFYKCLKCRYIEEVEHSHRYTEWAPYSSTEHKEMCLCGWFGTNRAAHVIRSTDVVGRTAPCIGCGYLVTIDPFGPPGQIIHNVQKVSINGSYVLPSGIIVLVDEDVEAYKDGTLVFYDKDSLPEVQ